MILSFSTVLHQIKKPKPINKNIKIQLKPVVFYGIFQTSTTEYHAYICLKTL